MIWVRDNELRPICRKTPDQYHITTCSHCPPNSMRGMDKNLDLYILANTLFEQ
jgi:hypothetical protein